MAKIRDKPRPGITIEQSSTRKTELPGNIATRFQHGNPGRPVGTRVRLNESFFKSLMRRFDKEGDKIIDALEPAEYARIVTALAPKQVEVDEQKVIVHISATHLTDDEWAAKWADPEPSSLATAAGASDSIN